MDSKTENFAFFLFFLLGKGKANYLSRKVILQKIFRVFQSCNFMRKNFQDKAGNFYCVPANFYLLRENLYSKLLNTYSKPLNKHYLRQNVIYKGDRENYKAGRKK